MLLDPRTWITSWKMILLLVGLVLIGKFLIWAGIVRLFGYRGDTPLRVGIGLTQIGEFSFILARISLQAKLITPEIYHATLAASLLTIVANVALFKLLKTAPVLPSAPLTAAA
jgi:CPA2 family monovalent cation:H+ antiporter-2